ncbi:MAG: hypothetical protein OXI35_03420, partial [Gemmatimonadota bacterium]|nr:hypothetical protein [Gemmatimonadota bacterium]
SRGVATFVGVIESARHRRGRHVATVSQGLQTAGPQTARWDGRDAAGRALPPGVYLISVVLQSERRAAALLRPVGVAY